jgi:hypothetical protein
MPTRTSNSTRKALPSDRFADGDWLHLRKGLKSYTLVELDSLDDYAEPKAPSKPRHLTLKRARGDDDLISAARSANEVLIQRHTSDNYFDRTAEIEEGTIVLPEMVPRAVTI